MNCPHCGRWIDLEGDADERAVRRGILDRRRIMADDTTWLVGEPRTVSPNDHPPLVDLTADEALQVAEGPGTLRALVHDYIARGAELNELRKG